MISREQLTNLLLTEVRLSRKDRRFLTYIWFLVRNRHPVTDNQNLLWEKLLIKYQRQLLKISTGPMQVDTEWVSGTVESAPSSTVRLTQQDGKWVLFVKVRDFPVDVLFRQKILPLQSSGNIAVPFTLPTLKHLHDMLENVPLNHSKFDPYLQQLVNKFSLGPDWHWQTCAMRLCDQILINNISPTLLPLLPKSSEYSLNTIAALTDLGIPPSEPFMLELLAEHGTVLTQLLTERHARVYPSQANNELAIIVKQALELVRRKYEYNIAVWLPKDIDARSKSLLDSIALELREVPGFNITVYTAGSSRWVTQTIFQAPTDCVITNYIILDDLAGSHLRTIRIEPEY